MRITYIFFFLIGSSTCVIGQQYLLDRMRDFQWISGIDYQTQVAGKDGFTLDFATLPPTVGYQAKPINFYLCNGNICNQTGQLQFYSNCNQIIGPTHQVMENGETLDWGDINISFGSPYQEGILALPKFDTDSVYYMLYMVGNLTGDIYGSIGVRVNLAKINMSLNGGLGKVIFKDLALFSDSLDAGKMTACRHANGRDWWIIVPRREEGSFHRILYDPAGFHDLGIQSFPNFLQFRKGVGNAIFSPDGNKYAIIDVFKETKPDTSFLFDFDRCSGLLSSPVLISQYTDSVDVANFAFSPNSRYLYKSFGIYVYQYDTYATDINASRQLVATSDGYFNIQPNLFMQMQLAPDGKIYITSRAAAPFLHRIDYPDRPGPACQVIQHCLDSLVATTFCIPSFPHFRLGPLDGSPCDTLGLDNLPWARFRYAQDDAANPMDLQFTDLTAFEPTYWHWDFGDLLSTMGANTSEEQHPVHTYTQPGIYQVCLRSGNAYGVDSTCREVRVLSALVETQERPLLTSAYRVFPNPTNGDLRIESHEINTKPRTATLYNSLGQVVIQMPMYNQTDQMSLTKISDGLYWLCIQQEGKVIYRQTVVKN